MSRIDAQTQPPPTPLTIDELAQGAGIPTSTVRLYQNKGLLPPPERKGRVGYYHATHQVRLRLIAQLQTRGFSLAAIKESLDYWDAGRSLAHLLGISNITPHLQRRPLRLSATEFAQRFRDIDLTQTDIQRAIALDLIALDGTDVLVFNEAFIDIGVDVARLGIPTSEILDEYENLQNAVGTIADRFRDVFEHHFWKPFIEQGLPPSEITSLSTAVQQLTDLATRVVTTELHERFAAFAEHYLARASTHTSKTTTP